MDEVIKIEWDFRVIKRRCRFILVSLESKISWKTYI